MSNKTKIWLIVAVFLILIGFIILFGIMSILKWDFSKLSTFKYETNNYEINKNYENISINTNTANVVFVLSEDTKTSVVCYEETKMKHSVAVKNNTLSIEVVNTRKWYENIGINFGSPEITVSLPKNEYGNLFIKTSTGNIYTENISAETVSLSASTGRITLSNLNCKADLNLKVSTGKTILKDIECKNLISTGSTGNISLENVIASEKFSIKISTGDVSFKDCDASEIFVETDTGNVKGNFLSDKVYITETDTGRIDVPKTTSGGKCEIKTDTGDIKFK